MGVNKEKDLETTSGGRTMGTAKEEANLTILG